jgi:hypothetical protein
MVMKIKEILTGAQLKEKAVLCLQKYYAHVNGKELEDTDARRIVALDELCRYNPDGFGVTHAKWSGDKGLNQYIDKIAHKVHVLTKLSDFIDNKVLIYERAATEHTKTVAYNTVGDFWDALYLGHIQAGENDQSGGAGYKVQRERYYATPGGEVECFALGFLKVFDPLVNKETRYEEEVKVKDFSIAQFVDKFTYKRATSAECSLENIQTRVSAELKREARRFR